MANKKKDTQEKSSLGDALDWTTERIERTVDQTVGTVGKAVGSVGRVLRTPLDFSSMLMPGTSRQVEPGHAPGIEHVAGADEPPEPGRVLIDCYDIGPDVADHREIADLDAFLDEPRPEAARVRWINVDGLDAYVIKRFMQTFNLHTLAAEDVLNVPQRPKVESFGDHLLVIANMLMLQEEGLHAEQISFFVRDDLVITFQQTHGDVWQPIRDRIAEPGSRLRNQDASYLLYALLDAVVDHCFPILENFGDRLEAVDDIVLKNPTPPVLQKIHGIKRELSVLRRVLWPMRDMIDALNGDDDMPISDFTRPYLRDVHDHALRVIDVLETYREMATGLSDLYMSAVSNRMNEVMKVLTIMASVFIPITFIAGVYGMNFETEGNPLNLPELGWAYSYPVFWGVCLTVVVTLLIIFRRKRWI